MSGIPKWDIKTIRSAVVRVAVVRKLRTPVVAPDRNPAATAAYLAGFDDCCELIDRMLRKMTEAR